MSEILAPAGDKNSALAAINARADAIYLGLKQFSARSSAENFDFEAFEEIARTAHAFGVKVYVAMNTLVKDDEVESFVESAKTAWNSGADALIISDIFLGKFIKENYPQIVLHLSTQAGVCNSYAAELAKEIGFSRVILSRETAIEDVEKIAKIIETEVFVQGALCTCFSGQCYLSSFAGGNSGNRGKCKQPCRKLYSIDRSGFEEQSYRLSLSDLSVGENIEKLVAAGVYSFKIEGRMRRAEYVAAAVKYYKNILSGKETSESLSDLKRTYNRGNYTGGLAFGQDKSFISSAVQGHIGEFVGVIKVENGKFVCQSRLEFVKGDGFKILRDGKEVGGASYFGETKGGFVLTSRDRLKNGDKVFVTTDTSLNCRLLSKKRTINIQVSAKFEVGSFAEIHINGEKFSGEKLLEKAQGRPLTVEDVKNCFNKTDIYPFSVEYGEISTGGVFVPASELNAVRRNAYKAYFDKISQNNNVKVVDKCEFPDFNAGNNKKTAAICKDLNGVVVDIGILKPDDYSAVDGLCSNFNGEKYLYLPPYLTGAEIEKLKPVINKFDGIYCDGIYAFKLCEELNKPLFAGTGMNISNKIDVGFCKAKYFAVSKELTASEARKLSTGNAFYLAAGAIKVMDLIYCPFEKKCKTCDRKNLYTLTDENGRKFPLRRYKTDACRFEVYNCAQLVTETFAGLGKLFDCSLEENAQKLITAAENTEKLKKYYSGNYTRGHSLIPIK
ncbi:MAG: U32 family peptidase [Clostridia bacterium]|nr:U32 family peptidase [Clostridia bacterium]